jgi:hypothetical protein
MLKTNKALTLLELLAATIILSLTIVGIAGIFLAGQRYIQHNRMRMAGGELGGLFLDPLNLHVRQDTWDQTTNALRIGTGSAIITYCDSVVGHTQNPACPTLAERTLQNIVYSATFKVYPQWSQPLTYSKTRTAEVEISWNEPST